MDIKRIILSSIYGELTDAEQQEFTQWLSRGNHQRLYERIYRHLTERDAVRFLADTDTEAALRRVKKRIRRPKMAVIATLSGIAAVLLVGMMLLPQMVQEPAPVIEVACPTITLATGEVLRLDGSAISHCSTTANIQVAGDSIQIKDVRANMPTAQYNTLDVPHGESFSVTLPDGSRVWVNALSSLKFPSSFEGMSDRTVEVAGEAYFEVARDSLHPFRVITQHQTIVVTGTTFNVCAYTHETSRTTLCSGSVSVSTISGEEIRLSPGEQLTVTSSGKAEVARVNTDVYTAWIRGEYYFDNQTLDEVFTVLAKWFDIDGVAFSDAGMRQRVFSGKFKKSDGIRTILQVIEKGTETKIDYTNERINIEMN